MISYIALLAMAPAPSDGAAGTPFWVQMLPPVVLFALAYFIFVRPQIRKQKEQEVLTKSIKSGDKVLTQGGIYGTVSNVKEGSVLVKIADGVKVEFEKNSIIKVVKSADATETT